MYLEHFGLRVFPFATTPDPHFFYPSAKHREALACLIYAVEQRKGFGLITGEVGAGKSMLCRTACERLGERVETALIVHTSLTPKQFFQALCGELRIPFRNRSKIEMLHAVRAFLEERREAGHTVVLLVDEAQNLSRAVLEEIRMLGNLETNSEKLVQIILVGQPELRQIIAAPELRQLNQRMSVKFHLGALSEDDVKAYIDHRLLVAGAPHDAHLFDPEAQRLIALHTGGVPRLVNVLCDQGLLEGYLRETRHIDADVIRHVVGDMEGYYMDAPPAMRSSELRVH